MKKKLIWGGIFTLSIVSLGYLVFDKPQETKGVITCDDWREGQICPVPPEIGQPNFIYVGNPHDTRRVPNRDRMGINDSVTFQIKDNQGNPYPLEYRILRDGRTTPLLNIDVFFDVRKGDGQTISRIGHDFVGLADSSFSTWTFLIRNRPVCYESTLECTNQQADLLNNPLTPGPVTLTRVEIKIKDFDGSVIQTRSANTNVLLFTVGEPPRLTGLNKTSVKGDETVTLSGANFDVPVANQYLGTNRITFDLNRGTGQWGRDIPWLGLYGEDRVHYCGPNRIKFDMPPNLTVLGPGNRWTYPPMPLGPHTVTLQNEWGWSNTLSLNLVSGQGAPEDDPACQNPPGQITSISPTSGPVGTVVTINGRGFGYGCRYSTCGSDSAVTFGGVLTTELVDFVRDPNAPDLRLSGTQIKVRVPAGAKTGRVGVQPTLRFTTLGPVFTVTGGGGGGGQVTSISPTSGPVGSEVVINGSGFASGVSSNTVTFNSQQAQVLEATATQIRAVVPNGSTSGPVTVQPIGQAVITGPVFTVTEGPGGGGVSITSVIPGIIYRGESNPVLIQGSGFTTPTTITTNSSSILVSDLILNSDKSLVVNFIPSPLTPAGPVRVFVADNAGNSASFDANLSNRKGTEPVISDLNITPLSQDEVKIEVRGQNFASGTTAKIFGLPTVVIRRADVVSESQINIQATVLLADPNFSGLVKRVHAASNLVGVLVVENDRGLDSTSLDLQSLSIGPSGGGLEEETRRPTITTGFTEACSRRGSLAACIKNLYLLALGLGAIIAMLMIVLAGYRYMTAQGNAQQVETAKEAFTAAFIGLIIIFVAFILLYLINPQLVQFSELPLPPLPALLQTEGAECRSDNQCASGLRCDSRPTGGCTCVRGTGRGTCQTTGGAGDGGQP